MQPGTLIASRFVLERAAGEGGMGTVFRALDRTTGDHVAVKLVRDRDPRFAERFLREASILASIDDPGVVRYVAHGTFEEDIYLATEWLDGEDLASYLARERPTVAGSVAILTGLAGALSSVHARSIVHRDIKPHNVFLVGRDPGRLKLLDLGLARPLQSDRDLTGSGAMIGTAGYMAPEQVKVKAPLDARADVYSLGCVLFECLAGRRPFLGDNPLAILARIALEPPPKLSVLVRGVPPELENLVERMLAKQPAFRPKDAAEVRALLQRLPEKPDEAPRQRRAPLRPKLRRQLVPVLPEGPALTDEEQRIVTVLIAAPPEPGATRAEGAEARLQEAVEPGGGQLDMLADGSLVVTFDGADGAVDVALKAARCALALQRVVPELRIVIGTGRALLSDHEGEGSRLPLGEVIDRCAATLLDTERGAILADDSTGGLIGAAFYVRRSGALLQLLGEREAADEARTLLGKPMPIVGREGDIGHLMGQLDGAAVQRRARAVLIIGAPGIGKSRLRREVIWRAGNRIENLTTLVGRGDASQAGAPFGMLRRAIRRAARIVEAEPLDLKHRKLRARLARHLDGEALARAAIFVAELAGAPYPDAASERLRRIRTDPLQLGDAMRLAFEDWIAAECAAGPVLFVLEDLHWGDLPSVSYLDATLRNLHDRPLMVLATARPEVHERFPGLWSERGLQVLELGGLPRAEAEALARQVLGSAATPSTVEFVVDRADGNPFFLEELLRVVLASRAARPRSVPAGSSTGDRLTALPDTVLGMVQARLAALPDDLRRVLRAASVFGARFWRGGVVQLLGGPGGAPRIDAQLADLLQREMIVRRTSDIPGEEEYVFRTDLLREAAYAALTENDRALGHRLAGAWLETAGAAEALTLAEHFDRGGEPAQAVGWYLKSAQRALDGDDLAGALARAERGFACGATGATLGALRLVQAEAHRWRGAPKEAVRCALEAARLVPAGHPAWFRAVAAALDASLAADEAEVVLREASSLDVPPDVRSAQLLCLCRGATFLLEAGRVAPGEELFARIEELASKSGPFETQVPGTLARARAVRALHGGDLAGHLAFHQQSLEALRAADEPRAVCMSLVDVGRALAMLGQYAQAEDVLRQALSASERLGIGRAGAEALQCLGDVLAHLGRLEEARESLRRAVARPDEEGQDRLLADMARVHLAAVLERMGDAAGAERLAREAVAGLASTPAALPLAQATLAGLLLRQRRISEALAAAREAAEGRPAGEHEGRVSLALVEALDAAGQGRAARELLADACRRLLDRAGRIDAPPLRESYLVRVPENERILALSHLWSRSPR